MIIVVFLGPSLGIADAMRILPGAIYLPPAQQADVVTAVERYCPDIIGLIDGYFAQALSVWHKEIAYALDQGVRMFGAASMGALRAAEMAPLGMLGVGEVYRLFSSGELEDDDEVAILHGTPEEGYPPLSEAMVNLRATFHAAHEAEILDASERDALVEIAKGLHFTERRIPMIARLARQQMPSGVVDRLVDFIDTPGGFVDLKRADARLLLQTLKDLDVAPCAPPDPGETLVRSRGFLGVYEEDRRVERSGVEVPLRAIAGRAARQLPDYDDISLAATNRALVQVLAAMLELTPTDSELEAARDRFQRARNLTDDGALASWLAANDMSASALDALLVELATCRRLQRWLLSSPAGVQHSRWILDELRMRGQYVAVAEGAAAQPDEWSVEAEFRGAEDRAQELWAAQRAREKLQPLLRLLQRLSSDENTSFDEPIRLERT